MYSIFPMPKMLIGSVTALLGVGIVLSLPNTSSAQTRSGRDPVDRMMGHLQAKDGLNHRDNAKLKELEKIYQKEFKEWIQAGSQGAIPASRNKINAIVQQNSLEKEEMDQKFKQETRRLKEEEYLIESKKRIAGLKDHSPYSLGVIIAPDGRPMTIQKGALSGAGNSSSSANATTTAGGAPASPPGKAGASLQGGGNYSTGGGGGVVTSRPHAPSVSTPRREEVQVHLGEVPAEIEFSGPQKKEEKKDASGLAETEVIEMPKEAIVPASAYRNISGQ